MTIGCSLGVDGIEQLQVPDNGCETQVEHATQDVGNPETTTGGNALKFYSSVRLDIRRIGQIKDGDQVTGSLTRVKVVKNKVAPPFRKAEFEIRFGEGISKVGEIIDLGVEFGIVKKSGAWFSYEGTKLGQGRDAAKQMVTDNPELAEEIEAKIKEAMKAPK